MASPQNDFIPPETGETLLSWTVDDYPRHERSRRWYIVVGIIVLALLAYALYTANFLFAIILVMGVVISLLTAFRDPHRVHVAITTMGLIFDDMLYEYPLIQNFSVIHPRPDITRLYIDFSDPWRRSLSIPLEEANPLEVKQTLSQFVQENVQEHEERLTDTLRRVYKF